MVAFVGTVLFSCAPKVVTPAAPPAPPADVLSPALAEGKSLYENNCAKCHDLYDRRQFTAEQWTPITISMAKKAKIDEATRVKIYNYLTHN